MNILRVLAFADFTDWPRSTRNSSRKIRNPKNKTPQKLTPFSQIKNKAFSRLVPLGRYTLDLNKNINMTFHWKKQPSLDTYGSLYRQQNNEYQVYLNAVPFAQ